MSSIDFASQLTQGIGKSISYNIKSLFKYPYKDLINRELGIHPQKRDLKETMNLELQCLCTYFRIFCQVDPAKTEDTVA